jgi:hypothetical protein
MSQAKSLIFESFTVNQGQYVFKYLLDEVTYEIQLSHSTPSQLITSNLQTVLFNLGMCYLIDIAEVTVPQSITINFNISELQLNFWQTLYEEVAKEKMYIYHLDLKLLEAKWQVNKTGQKFEAFSFSEQPTKISLCLTGGKESLTLLKLLKGKKDLLLFFLNPETSIHRQRVFDRVKDEFLAVRTISNRPQILRAIKEKYQSGFGSGVDMAHLVFNSLLLSTQYVLIGNEYSANFSNFVYQGYPINHQYVKSLHFAQKINRYLKLFVTDSFKYHSPFFGLYEYVIASPLFKTDEYLEVLTSCNKTTEFVNFCSDCHKCAFTYLISALYTTEAHLKTYFSRDLLADVNLFKPLMDFVGEKPLDCVGEKIEAWVALDQLSQKEDFKNKPVVQYFREKIRPFIATELPKFKKEITTIQTVPERLPDDLELLIQETYGNLGS